MPATPQVQGCWGRRLPKRKKRCDEGVAQSCVADGWWAGQQTTTACRLLLGLGVVADRVDALEGRLRCCCGHTGINVGPSLTTQRQQLGALALAARLQGWPMMFKRSPSSRQSYRSPPIFPLPGLPSCAYARSVLLFSTYSTCPTPRQPALVLLPAHYWTTWTTTAPAFTLLTPGALCRPAAFVVKPRVIRPLGL